MSVYLQRIATGGLAALLSAVASTSGAQQLPVPCGTCAGAAGFVTSGAATYSTSGTVGTIRQTSERAILNWQSFNIGAGNTVNFKQPSSNSAALNRIHQNDPSRILGNLNANGQVYLINQNGIIFGQGAKVDTRALTASTLDVSDEIFNDVGITGAINLGDSPGAARAAFEGSSNGAIRIEKGVKLHADERIVIIGADVENRGTIETPGGQAILAGSHDKVYLASDRDVRGLLVEVDTGGSVTNLGDIITEQGNSTLVGLSVNQSGRVHATTSVNVNGSIRLLARDKASPTQFTVDANGVRKPVATRAGTLTHGQNSVTEVQPDHGTKEAAVDGQDQPQSSIELVGKSVKLDRGAKVIAPGGKVAVIATSRPNQPLGGTDKTARIHLAEGSVIDVSGETSAIVPMERNQGKVKLFGNELADAPVQRGGPIAREEITVDLRKGTPITDISRLREDVKRTVGERLAAGGEVSLRAEGDVVLQPGSVIDFSGGQVRYLDGYLQTTKLVSQGRIFDISDADPRLAYDGIFGQMDVEHKKWGVTDSYQVGLGDFHAGYIEGKDAGSLVLQGAAIAMNGTLRGDVVRGRWQREPADPSLSASARTYTQVPLQGLLDISKPGNAEGASVRFVNARPTQSYDFASPLPADLSLLISQQQLRDAGINRVEVTTSGLAVIPAEVSLALEAGGELNVTATELDVAGDIRIPAGKVNLAAATSGARQGRLSIAGSSNIDVRGGWVNDSPAVNNGALGTMPVHIAGGSVTLNAQGDLTIASGSVIDVSGGARLQANGDIDAGKAGTIALVSKVPNQNVATTLDLRGQLNGYGLEEGGTLKLDAAGFRIGSGIQSAPNGTVNLSPAFFANGGFRAYDLAADRGGIEVMDGTRIRIQPGSLRLNGGYAQQATGADLLDFTAVALLPDFLRGASSFSAKVSRVAGVGDADATVRVGTGARIETEAGGTIELSADSDVLVNGTLAAPAGGIAIALNSPTSANERGFRASQAIRVGPSGALDVSGLSHVVTSQLGYREGEVMDGGRVTLQADRGYVMTSPGSLIDVSGTAATIDLPGDAFGRPVPTTIASKAGSVSIQAAEGISLGGRLHGNAGGPGVAGGSVRVSLDTTNRDPNNVASDPFNPLLTQFPEGQREILIGSGTGQYLTDGVAVPSGLNGKAFVSAGGVRRGGFDDLEFVVPPLTKFGVPIAAGAVKFDGDVTLSAGRRISLDAAVIASSGGAADIGALLVEIGPTERRFRATATAATGTGHISVSAQHIDLRGNSVFSGFADGGASPAIDLSSEGDIRAIGVRIGGEASRTLPGSLTSVADIRLRAAQIYPSTLTDFAISVTGTDGRIVIGLGGSVAPPLSAAGSLKLAAADIEQGGVLRAPFGSISLDATRSLTLGAGSITSTSGAGIVVPFGLNEFGTTWVYPLGGVTKVLEATPEKSVVLRSPDVSIAEGALVDVRGGGDLLTYEFIKGPGGSRDILLGDNPEGAFAIIPGLGSRFGVYDFIESSLSGIDAGSTIYLAGGGGVPAGTYVRLPARYALLPGAFLITPVSGTQDIQAGAAQLLPDKVTPVVAGKLGYAGTTISDARWSGYAVENGAQMRQRAEYNETRASSFFAKQGAGVPGDSGRLTIDADRSIRLDGALAAAAAGGRGAEVDFVADNLAVVNSRTGSQQRVELVDAELQYFGAASVLIGGSRQRSGDTVTLDVSAQTVRIENDTDLSAPEIVLAATDTIAVARTAKLSGTGAADADGASVYKVNGDGAFARVSAGSQADVQRTGSPGQRGRVVIDEGATLTGKGSINLEASRDVVSSGDLVTPGGSLSLTASLISLGDTGGPAQGLVLSNADLARFQAAELLLNSRSTIDLYGAVAADLDLVRLDAAGLRGFNNSAAAVSLAASELTLVNSLGSVGSTTGTGTGALTLAADTLSLDGGSFDISGFDSVEMNAVAQFVANADSALRVGGDTTIAAPRLTAGAGVDAALSADGAITTVARSAHAGLQAVSALGASMTMTAQSISHGSRIELPSGNVTLRATGSGGAGLQTGSSIDVSGRDIDFAGVRVGSPGGNVALIAQQGDINIDDGASIDVSGAPAGGNAGKLTIQTKNGALAVGRDADLRGSARQHQAQGTFSLVARTLSTGFSALNSLLNAGLFNERRDVSLRSGSVAIAGDEVIKARNVDVAVDGGAIDLAGRIDASAEQGGRVRLSARDNVTLRGSARIDARATGKGEDGGEVELSTQSGTIVLEPTDTAGASTIDVSGTDDAGGATATGRVALRAPRVGANGVGVAPIAGVSISGAQRVDIEAVRTYDATTINTVLINTISSNTTSYMANAAAIENAIGVGSNGLYHLLPGVEIRSSGNLTLSTAWDLINWRYGGDAGVLTLRAGGDLNINQSLSDGFASQEIFPGYSRDVVQTGQSWSYRLVAGAAADAADPLGVSIGVGSVTVGSNVRARTGTGSIDIIAGDDVVLSTGTSSVYTAGANRGTGILDPLDAEVLLRGDFVDNGGDIRIEAGGDVRGVSDRALPDWMPRVAGEFLFYKPGFVFPAAWAIDASKFQQGVGALGGGDISIVAGGNMESLTVALPSNGQPNALDGSDTRIGGGGDLDVDVAGDIRGGMYMIGRGRGDVRSRGSITNAGTGAGWLPILQIADGQFSLEGRKGVSIETVFNPTLAEQDPNQGLVDQFFFPQPTYFFTFSERSAANFNALSGDVNLLGRGGNISSSYFDRLVDPDLLIIYPGSLSARSLQGDIRVNSRINLFPSSIGELDILAEHDVTATGSGLINLSDGDIGLLPGVSNPTGILNGVLLQQLLSGHAPAPVHALDDEPARIVARTGAVGTDGLDTLGFNISKQARIAAGKDISNVTLSIQHARDSDISVLESGRDIAYTTIRRPDGSLSANSNFIDVAGPGRVDLIAAGDVDFGTAVGIQTRGDLSNPALADGGADISIWTGLGRKPDIDAFITRYLTGDSDYGTELRAYMKRFAADPALSDVENFRALDEVFQREFVMNVFYSELREAGIAATTDSNSGFDRGFDAIETLFPGAEYDGDMRSFLSRISTLDGGDINLAVPGGLVNAGVASSGSLTKRPDELGIVVQRDGDINAFVKEDFLVNASRVFTLDGGDILIWSSKADIDAGRGAKSALAIPPPITTFDAQGNVVIEFPPAISGSGIRTAVSTAGRTPGDVFLFAPSGVVNAGDAGIESAGNITVAAVQVVGADNISVAGTSVGVPTVSTSSLAAGLTGVGDVASAATKSVTDGVASADTGDAEQAAKEAAESLAAALSFISVEFLGYGEG